MENKFLFALRSLPVATAVSSLILLGEVHSQAQGPRLTGARGSGFPYGIIVSFAPSVEAGSATNRNNYQVSGQNVTLEGVTLLSSNQVLLSVTPFQHGSLDRDGQ